MFSVSLVSAGLDGSEGFFVISFGLGEVLLGGGDDVGIFGNGSFEGCNSIDLITDLFLKSVDGFIAKGLVSLVLFVSFGLGFNDVLKDLVND